MIDGYSQLGKKGATCDVWIKPKALKDSKNAHASDLAKAQLILDHIKKHGTADLPDGSFRDEGKHPSGVSGMTQQHVFAIRAGQLRLYCGFVGDGQMCLIIAESLVKKTQKADQKLLQRVAKEIGQLNDKHRKSV